MSPVVFTARAADLGGGVTVRRALPVRAKRTIGAWCFLDHFGPVTAGAGAAPGIAVGPHPHIGLQTVTWLFDGELVHLDSIGSRQTIVGGQLNLMTSGAGIAHAEIDPPVRPPRLHGLQLWIALPGWMREVAPSFAHHAALPTVVGDGWRATVVIGSFLGRTSPAEVHSALVGADLTVAGAGSFAVDLDPAFEHGLYVVEGEVALDTGEDERTTASSGQLVVLEPGRAELRVTATSAARLMLVGGAPFPEPIHMWWNFVAGSREALERAVTDWNDGDRFGVVIGSGLPRVPAPRPTWLSAPT